MHALRLTPPTISQHSLGVNQLHGQQHSSIAMPSSRHSDRTCGHGWLAQLVHAVCKEADAAAAARALLAQLQAAR